MENFEKVQKVKEQANVSYEDAKMALEASDWDILDAMIYLEKLGKVSGSSAHAQFDEQEIEVLPPEQGKKEKESFGEMISRFGRWCTKWIEKGNANSFCIDKSDKEILRVPITLLIILLLFAFWVVVPLLVIGLFFEMRYHFRGPDIKMVDLNQAMDTVADAAENIKNDIKENAKDRK